MANYRIETDNGAITDSSGNIAEFITISEAKKHIDNNHEYWCGSESQTYYIGQMIKDKWKDFKVIKKKETIKSDRELENLIRVLRNETQSLEIQYLNLAKEFAAKEYYELKDWLYRYHKGEFGFGVASKKAYNIHWVIQDSRKNVDDYVAVKLSDAQKHYDQSIEKLAYRIKEKGLNIENLKAKTSHVGVNIETTLTDGEKIVRAYTIIAGGDIQRPHYRYLIK